MLAAPQRSRSPLFSHCPSPLSLSLFLGEQRAATCDQTVPISPTLSPLAQRNRSTTSLEVISVSNRTAGIRHSPSPALVPECNDRMFSGSPLLRQILTGIVAS